MFEVEVWILSRGPRQRETAAAAFARVADEPRRYGLERVEGTIEERAAQYVPLSLIHI